MPITGFAKTKKNISAVSLTITMPRDTRYSTKNEKITIVNFVKKGRDSYFIANSSSRKNYQIPSSYISQSMIKNATQDLEITSA